MRVIHKVSDAVKKMELSISDDRLKLFAKIEPQAECSRITLETLLQDFKEVTPSELLEMDVLKDICNELRQGKGCDSRRVARGKPAEAGRDGKVVWMVRRFSPSKTGGEDREFSDLFSVGLFENVEAGAEIARIYRPSGGTAGVDVEGKELPARAGQAVNSRWDRTVELRTDPAHENYTSVIATIAGYVHEDANSVSVRNTLELSGNLDWSMGHIDFIGHVRIAGDVQKGFHIKARGDIDIGGSVLGENVLTSQGSIRIDGFHLGDRSSVVTAKADYSAGIAQGVTANVGGNVTISREARDCTLRAGLGVYATNAAIVGGSIWCVKGLEAETLGNVGGVTTIVELRNELEVTKEYLTLSESLKKHEAALAALELHIGPYLKNRHRVPLLKNQFRAKIASLLDKYDGVVQSLNRLREQEKAMRESKPVFQEARVSASGHIHAGVVLNSGDAHLELKEEVAGPISYRKSEQGEWVPEKFQKLPRG